MKITKIKLGISSFFAGLFILAGGTALAAPVAAVVTPATVTSGSNVSVLMHCTVEGNTISAVNLVSGGNSNPISSFTPHVCTASDVTSGFTELVTVTNTGSTATTATITYTETGSTAGGSPGTSPASNSFTVNPPTSTNTKLEITGSTVALDGSNPITNNMWLKHTYTIKNIGSANLVINSANDDEKVWFKGGHWFNNGDGSSIISNGGLPCTKGEFGYDCTNFTLTPGQSVTFSFKDYFQECKDDNTGVIGSTYTSYELNVLLIAGNVDVTSTDGGHTFSYKYLGCDFNSNPGASSSNGSTTKVPKTGFSGLTNSLAVIASGLVLAGGSVIAINKFRA